MDFLPIRRALLSVTHKDGLAEFATFLHANGVELVSTGGTLKFLENAGLPVTAVSDVTGCSARRPRTSTASSYCPIPIPTRKPRRNSRPTI